MEEQREVVKRDEERRMRTRKTTVHVKCPHLASCVMVMATRAVNTPHTIALGMAKK